MTQTFTDPSRIEADYLIETAFDPNDAAETMAGEQSSGTFMRIPGETAELKERSAARVERVEIIETVNAPTLPGAGAPKGAKLWHRALVTLSWPVDNIGPSLPNLITTIAGNLFELNAFSGLRLLDIRLPSTFAQKYPGPKFGIEGTRRLAGVFDRPLIGTIVKPSVGLSAEATGQVIGKMAEAGIDFVKDDELQADGPACPFEARVDAVMDAVNRVADQTGRKVMVAFNLTGEIDEMRRRHDYLLARGGTCIMASLNSVGMTGMIELARFTELPIHAHRSGWGALTREPMLGWSYAVWSKLWRLAGCDHMHVNGLANKFTEPDDSVIASAKSLADPMFADAPMQAIPVFSSGQTIRQAASTWAEMQSPDLIHCAGGGIMGHPMGVAAGVEAFVQAWEAAMAGTQIEEYAKSRPALSAALETYPA